MNTPMPASPAHRLCPPPPLLWGLACRKSSPHSQSRSQKAVGIEPPGRIREQKPKVRLSLGKGPLPIWSNPGSGPSSVSGRICSHILPAPPKHPSPHTLGWGVVVRGAMCSASSLPKEETTLPPTSFPPPPSLGLWESTGSQQGLTGRETSPAPETTLHLGDPPTSPPSPPGPVVTV